MNDNEVIFKNSVILYLRLIIGSAIGLFTSRFVIRSLGASDFGLYSVVGGVVVLMAYLNTIMITATYRFIAFELGKGDSEGVKRVFNISLVIHLCVAVLVLVLGEIVGVFYIKNYLNVPVEKVADALFVFRFSMIALLFSIISIPYQGLITAQENFLARAIIEIARSILGFSVAVVIVYYMGNKLRMYAVLTALANAVPPIFFLLYCNTKYKEIVRWSFQLKWAKYKEMLGFSGWTMIGAAASIGKINGADLIINAFFGTVLNAAFGIAKQINSIVLSFSRNLGQAAIPQITKSFSSGNKERTITLVAYISKYTFFLMLLPSLPILLETDYLLTLWLGDVVPEYTIVFTQLMIFNALVESLGEGISSAINATGKIKYFQIILSTTSLISLPIAYFLFILNYPPFTILVVFASTALLNVIIRQMLLKRLINFNVKYFLKTSYLKILYVSLLVMPLFIVKNFFQNGFTRFLILSCFSILWFFVAVYLVGVEKKEKVLLVQTIKNIFAKD